MYVDIKLPNFCIFEHDPNVEIFISLFCFLLSYILSILHNLHFPSEETCRAIKSVLSKTTLHEIEVERRLRMLRSMGSFPGTHVQWPELNYRPIRVEIPMVNFGFVYILVSLKDKSLRTLYVGQTKRSVLTRLQEHNSGHGSTFTLPVHRRPWSLAAFAFNFLCDNERLSLETATQQLLFFNLRIDVFVEEFKKLCQSGLYGNINFCCCSSINH